MFGIAKPAYLEYPYIHHFGFGRADVTIKPATCHSQPLPPGIILFIQIILETFLILRSVIQLLDCQALYLQHAYGYIPTHLYETL